MSTLPQHQSFQRSKNLIKWSKEKYATWSASPKYATRVIPETSFLPIKLPLSSAYEIHFDEKASFTPTEFIESLVSKGKDGETFDMGMVIDATGTDEYFHDRREWEDWDVEYVKIDAFHTERGELPSKDALQSIFDRIEAFETLEKGSRQIAIFCQQHFNVTGYIIVSYLIEKRRKSLDAALSIFQKAYPPGIFAHSILTVLYKKYFGVLSLPSLILTCPATPHWVCHAFTDIGSSIGPAQITDDERPHPPYRHGIMPSKKRAMPPPPAFTLQTARKAPAFALPTTTKPVVGTPPVKRRRIRNWEESSQPLSYGTLLVKDSEEYASVADKLRGLVGVDYFPGAEAVAVSASHVSLASRGKSGSLTKDYLVSWRARGHRCLLFILKEKVYGILRGNQIYKFDLRFPRKRNVHETLNHTLLDGIMVMDKDEHNNMVPRYLAFDLLFLENAPIWKSKFDKRLQLLQNEVIGPRKRDTSYDYALENIRVRMKDHFPLAKTKNVLEHFISKITHAVEGLIFTPSGSYGLGGYETPHPLFKCVPSTSAMPFDGSVSTCQLLQHIDALI